MQFTSTRPVTLAAAALLAFAAAPAFADNDSGPYVGAGLGQFNVKVDDVGDAASAAADFDADDSTLKLFAGWRFNPFIALELDYMDLGKPEDTIDGTKIQAKVNGVAPFLIGTLPVGPFEVFGKVGYYFYDIEFKAQDLGSLNDSSQDLVYGVGAGITLFERVHARLEYERIDISDADEANALWLSAAYRF